jgi:hypothetical protein
VGFTPTNVQFERVSKLFIVNIKAERRWNRRDPDKWIERAVELCPFNDRRALGSPAPLSCTS